VAQLIGYDVYDVHLASMYYAVGKKSITNKGCNLWNKLPEILKQ